MVANELVIAINSAVTKGDITQEKADALKALLSLDAPLTGENVGAVDWTRLLQMIQTMLPIIVQLLPVILALFAPKPTTPATTQPSNTPVLDVIKNISVK